MGWHDWRREGTFWGHPSIFKLWWYYIDACNCQYSSICFISCKLCLKKPFGGAFFISTTEERRDKLTMLACIYWVLSETLCIDKLVSRWGRGHFHPQFFLWGKWSTWKLTLCANFHSKSVTELGFTPNKLDPHPAYKWKCIKYRFQASLWLNKSETEVRSESAMKTALG